MNTLREWLPAFIIFGALLFLMLFSQPYSHSDRDGQFPDEDWKENFR